MVASRKSDEFHISNQDFTLIVKITDASRAIFTTDISHHSDSFLFAEDDGVIRAFKLICIRNSVKIDNRCLG